MTPLYLRPIADLDVREAAHWYDEQADGLGVDFLRAVGDALEQVSLLPTRFPVVLDEPGRRVYRALVRRFPYAIYFVVQPTRVIVVGVFNQRRKSTVWRSRVK